MATWQDLLSQLFGGSPPITGSQSGAPMGAPMMPTPQLSPGSMTPPPSPSPSMWGAQGLGSLGLINAGANMLNAKPGSSLGQVIGQGIGGGIEGMGAGAQIQRLQALTAGEQAQTAGQGIQNQLGQMQLKNAPEDRGRALANEQADQALRQKVYEHWMNLTGGGPTGAQPNAAPSPSALGGGPVRPPVMLGGGPAPAVPGAPPVPGPGAQGGGMPLGGRPPSTNPFIQQMLMRRMGMRA